ncbi:hypothetical protein ACRAWB_10020 [Leifsonia poae]|uniref:hypothetical protein n=1 Tax=Leifsonia poae TaxID=110933 RepID=UPI003D681407
MTLTSPTDGTIVSAEAWISDLEVETVRTDAVQSFLKQETIFVRLRTAGGVEGIGYSYTIGTGGAAVLSLLRETLLDVLIGLDANRPEDVWRTLFSSTRATTVGLITSLALAAVDTAVWDARCKAAGLPLWVAAGGAQPGIPSTTRRAAGCTSGRTSSSRKRSSRRRAAWAG